MITLKSQREIDLMEKSGAFLASIHIGLRDLIKPGIDMWEIENMSADVVRRIMLFRFRLVWKAASWTTLMPLAAH